MNIETSLTTLLTNFTNKFRANLEFSMNEIGLHSGQVFVLISLWQNDGQSQIRLAQNLNLAAPTVNKMVKSLADNDFVFCQKCGEDGRKMRIYLTDKGRKSESLVKSRWQKVESASFANLTDTEKLIFSQLLIKLRENLVK